MVMIYPHANVQVQRAVGTEDKMETNGRTDGETKGGNFITSFTNAFGSKGSINNKNQLSISCNCK